MSCSLALRWLGGLGLAEQRVHHSRRLAVQRGRDVRVDVQGHRDGAVKESAGLNHVGPHSAGVRQWGPADPAETAKLIDKLTGGPETNPPARP
jgi:hypothetical protein